MALVSMPANRILAGMIMSSLLGESWPASRAYGLNFYSGSRRGGGELLCETSTDRFRQYNNIAKRNAYFEVELMSV